MKRLLVLVLGLSMVVGVADAATLGLQTDSALPAAASTASSRPYADTLEHVDRPLGSSQSSFYGAPYQWNDGHISPDGYHSSVSETANAFWAAYQRFWSVGPPGCTFRYSPTGDGVSTGTFALMYEQGSTCHGGPEYVVGKLYSYDPGKNNGCSDGCQAGDPINLGTGNEFEEQHDYSASGLTFARYYNSSAATATTYIGSHWRSNYDRSIEYLAGGSSPVATLFRPDGKQFRFRKINGTWTADADIHDTLLEDDNSGGQLTGWTYFVAGAQQIESYDVAGKLVSIEDLGGLTTTLTYSTVETPKSIAPAAGLLITVTGPRGRQLDFTYDANSRIVQIALPDGANLAYTYDAAGNLATVTYPGGAVRVYKYNESGNVGASLPNALTGIIDENDNRYADIHYDAQSRAASSQLGGIANLTRVAYGSGTTTVTWPLGVQSTLGLATPLGRMRVSSNSAPCGPSCNQAAASQTYDASGNLAGSTDFNGITTAYTYDANGLETQRIEALGTLVQRTINTTWDTVFRNPLERTRLDASGQLVAQTGWVYNPRGQVLARCEADPTIAGAASYACSNSGTAPSGVRRWTYTYCDDVGGQCPLVGLLLAATGPRADVVDTTSYAYYPTTDESGCGATGGACHRAGDLWKATNALGQVTQYASYDKDGRVTERIDPNGVATDFTYTPRGWLASRTVAGATTTISYDAVGDATRVTQPDGVYTTYGYDTAHRLVSIGDVLGDHVDFTLDAIGNRTAENTYAAGGTDATRTLSRAYNTLGELVKSLDAYGNATTYAYDADGNRTDTTDPLGVDTHQGYDALARLSTTVQNYLGTDAATANTTTSYTYDANDNVSLVNDPDDLSTSYAHDGLSDLTQLASPDTGTTTFTYDAAGNRISRTDARGITTTYTYDALNRLTSVRYPSNLQDVRYDYDQGNAATGCTGSYPIGRLTQLHDAVGTTTYCYDARGNVTREYTLIMDVPLASRTVTYQYNAANRLISIHYPDGTDVTYTRDAAGRIATVSATVNGATTPIVTDISYAPFGPATHYTFAQGGQVLSKTYDANYRATDITGTALNLHFKRNALGDIVAEGNTTGVPAPAESYAYDPLNRLQQVDSTGGTPWQGYTYNKTGDRLSKTTAGVADTYAYAAGTHHLTGISGGDVSNRTFDAAGNTTSLQAGGWTYTLYYNDANRLAAVKQNGVTTATYGINGLGQRVVKKLAGSGRRLYVYNHVGQLLGEYGGPTQRDYVWVGDTLVATIDRGTAGAAVDYVYTDALGTPRAVADTSGTVVWTWPYTQNPFGEAPASGNGYTLNLRFPGQYYDSEDGLNYNYHRDYEPGTGRYIESDPIGLRGGISTYLYGGSQPLDSLDRFGLQQLTVNEGVKSAMELSHNRCDWWPAGCITLCTEAICSYHDCNGYWTIKETKWVGAPGSGYPTPDEVNKLDNNCHCTKTIFYPKPGW